MKPHRPSPRTKGVRQPDAPKRPEPRELRR